MNQDELKEHINIFYIEADISDIIAKADAGDFDAMKQAVEILADMAFLDRVSQKIRPGDVDYFIEVGQYANNQARKYLEAIREKYGASAWLVKLEKSLLKS